MNTRAAVTGPIGVAIAFSIAFGVLFTPVNRLLFGQPQAVVVTTSVGAGLAVGVTRWLIDGDRPAGADGSGS